MVDVSLSPAETKKKDELPAMFLFANAVKEKQQMNLVKIQLRDALQAKMEEAKNARLPKANELPKVQKKDRL